MADNRYEVEALLRVRAPGLIERHLKHVFRCSRFVDRRVTVPAGKYGGAVLDNVAVTNATHPQFVALFSDEENVEWWPIDVTGTAVVDPDTEAPGWVLPANMPEYIHDHADEFQALVDHASVGTAQYHDDTFPTRISNKLDRDGGPWTGARILCMSDYAVADVGIGDDREALDLTHGVYAFANSGKILVVYFGMANYRNYGTATDGLNFRSVFYADDVSNWSAGMQTDGPILKLYCYPFSSAFPDPANIPALTPFGETTWANNDRNLDLGHVPNDGFYRCASFQATSSPDAPPVDGWQVWRHRNNKAEWGSSVESAAGSGQFNPGASPVWNRITMLSWEHETLISAAVDHKLANLWFGPPNLGGRRMLRPYDLSTHRAWTVGNKASVGLYNHGAAEANVRILYGTQS